MKSVYFTITVFLFSIAAAGQASCPVIPKPKEASAAAGFFLLKANTAVFISDPSLKPAYAYLQNELLRVKSMQLSNKGKAKKAAIQLLLSKEKAADKEAYTIKINPSAITVTASHAAGLFYGLVSLLQIIAQSPSTNNGIALPCWNISDAPQYGWRGLMLDESRHFFGKGKVKSLLDWMAFYKLNRFHWHLTDEPAWRLEIKKYPLLTTIGGKGNYSNPNAAANYYTQADVREIVQYAAERQILIIPEIDMPGHATAANRAYPEFSGGGSEKHPEFTFHPGKEQTYSYLASILRGTRQLFPAGLLHIGGDEVSFGNDKWSSDSLIKNLMIKNRLNHVKEVEQYFVQRIADSVYHMNAKLLAWDEVAEADLPRDKTIIFWWRQDHPEQLALSLNKGYNTVLCPRLPLYFDFVQDSTHKEGRKWNRRYNSLQDVYAFDISNIQAVNDARRKQILGIQANLWTETMPTTERLDYMLFPRIAALSEAAWTEKGNKNFEAFKQRLQTHFLLYQQQGIRYYNGGQ